jgi:hypothetical protein
MSTSSKVAVVSDPTTGAVINQSPNNPDWGYIKVEQSTNVYDDNGFLNRKKVTAIISAPIAILQEADYFAGQLLDGNIIVQESITPWNEKNPDRDLKVAGATGIICRIDGQPIYRKTFYSEKENAKDIYLAHDNVDELKRAYNAEKSNAIQADAAFDI